jgi:hypothetical protein
MIPNSCKTFRDQGLVNQGGSGKGHGSDRQRERNDRRRDFGIGHPFAAVLLAQDRDHDCIHVLAELKIRGGVPTIRASAMKRIAPNVPVAWPHDGNQRDKGSGRTLTSIYKAEGLKMLSTHATFTTGGYSTEAGIKDMLGRINGGRFKVSDHCREWHDEFQTYHRKEGLIVKVNDDLMSATRIGVMQIRSAKVVDVFIWHAQLFHGGVSIQRPGQTRTSLVTHYYSTYDVVRRKMDVAELENGSLMFLRPHPSVPA